MSSFKIIKHPYYIQNNSVPKSSLNHIEFFKFVSIDILYSPCRVLEVEREKLGYSLVYKKAMR